MSPTNLTRRAFHRAALTTAIGLGYTSRPRADELKGRYFDIHTHIGTVWDTGAELTATELLRWMDANDVAQAAVLPLVSPESSSYPISTHFVLAETKPHRDRLIPFCSIDPRTSVNGGAKAVLGMLERYVELGAKGFGEHKTGVRVDDPRNMKLYEAIAEVKLPVLYHMDNERNMDTPGLPGLAKVAQAFPSIPFIGHGQGWWASISGSASRTDMGVYPRTEVSPGGAIDVLMEKYPNIYGDLSAGSGANAIRRDLKFGREFLIRRADRLLFGTDFLAPGQDVPQLELYRQLDLPAEVQAKIFRENARRLVGLAAT